MYIYQCNTIVLVNIFRMISCKLILIHSKRFLRLMAAPVTSLVHIVADSLKKTLIILLPCHLVRLCPIILKVGNMNDFHFTNANTHYFFVYVEVQKEPKRRQHFAY